MGGQKHQVNNLYFKYHVCQMILRHLNTFLQFRLLFHEPHCSICCFGCCYVAVVFVVVCCRFRVCCCCRTFSAAIHQKHVKVAFFLLCSSFCVENSIVFVEPTVAKFYVFGLKETRRERERERE